MSFTLLGILNAQAAGAIAAGSFDHLETTNLGSNQTTVTFNNLNSTYGSDYQHLQFRLSLGRPGNDDRAGASIKIQSGQNFGYYHNLFSTGSTPNSNSGPGATFSYAGNPSLGHFSGHIFTILDAFDTNKNVTVQYFAGQAGNNEPYIQFGSMYRNNTFAVDSVDFYAAAQFATNSRLSLYGLKASA